MTDGSPITTGEVIKLDRGFPLVKLSCGRLVRCEHATALVKGGSLRAVIGDKVSVEARDDHDKAIIVDIHPRSSAFVRKDPTERALPQVLAANFDLVVVAQPLGEVNTRRLERELVLAHETGARVVVVLTKADLAHDEHQAEDAACLVRELAGPDVLTLVVSSREPQTVEALRELIGPGQTAVLIGRSGVGKSSLVNLLLGEEVQLTAAVREGDGKGRHTTVSRDLIELPGGGRIVDMPGVRGLGLWDADAGIEAAFSDIEELAANCRFRDCKHADEPGCAVLEALRTGAVSQARYESYLALKKETRDVKERREQARWLTGEKASETKRAGAALRRGKSSAERKAVSKDRRNYNRKHRQ